MGELACRALGRGPVQGTVLAASTHVVYLEVGGELLWLGPLGLPPHRRVILAPVVPATFGEGLEFTVSEGGLEFADGAVVELAGADTWVPAMPAVRAPLTTVSERAEVVRLAMGERAVWGGLGLEARLDMSRVLAGAWSLIGLGSGLTPAGDDYVGGVLFAARHLFSCFPRAVSWLQAEVEEFLKGIEPLTVRVSHVLLGDLARGHGPAPLHDLMVGILEGRPIGRCIEAAVRVRGIGQSTGCAMLAGLLGTVVAAARGAAEQGGTPQGGLLDVRSEI